MNIPKMTHWGLSISMGSASSSSSSGKTGASLSTVVKRLTVDTVTRRRNAVSTSEHLLTGLQWSMEVPRGIRMAARAQSTMAWWKSRPWLHLRAKIKSLFTLNHCWAGISHQKLSKMLKKRWSWVSWQPGQDIFFNRRPSAHSELQGLVGLLNHTNVYINERHAALFSWLTQERLHRIDELDARIEKLKKRNKTYYLMWIRFCFQQRLFMFCKHSSII